MDPYQKSGLIYNREEDTLERLVSEPRITTEVHNSLPNQTIFTKDIPLNTTHKTWLRLYTPTNPTPNSTKLPLILYFRGSGFVLGSASDTSCDEICTNMSIQLSAVVLSLEYRVAPENRLPASHDDAVEALLWIQTQALSGDTLNHDMIDFSKCYVMGTSTGGNIAYHAGLRASSMDLQPLVICGYVLDHPAFGGLERSGSELRLASDPDLGLADIDIFWELALPKGCNRDHEYCNFMSAHGRYKDKIGMLGRCMVNARGDDILVDYQLGFANMLKENGVDVVIRFDEQGCHGVDALELAAGEGKEFASALREFLSP